MREDPAERDLRIIGALKRFGEMSLSEVASQVSMTRMGALKRLASLEEKGIVGRREVRQGVGRPMHIFFLTDRAETILQASYGKLLTEFIDYLERDGRRSVITDFISARYEVQAQAYSLKCSGLEGEELMKRIEGLREEDGYMPQLIKGVGCYELLQFNCPILFVSRRVREACGMERKMLSCVTGMDVQVSHTIAENGKVCRFIFRPRSGDDSP
ncbi:MarR family transcriptional regulator [Thermogymnomonas acidicola]|uniref:MarR family transcriptional regulator n=1 Tax=Thermogymnomonas acidicola TaxID=399579 RepID=A0AA37F8U9_9ARCH|nr:winged helix-turn-helix transcriptional regulator [Thermogymnomonas acidicola]GGM68419.1 MarR family transcriptional regulator [Thermogymnomonas acidicola]